MAIGNYAQLVTAITDTWPARSDLSAQADDFILMAETLFNLRLRCRQMEASDDITPVSNVYALPDDYLEYKRVTELASIRRRLSYMTEDAIDEMYPTRAGGLSSHFTILGSNLYTYPLSSNDIELVYYQKIPALTSGNTTNWLLSAYPNLYLHTCLMYVGELIQDAERVASESAFVESYLGQIAALDNRGKFANAGVSLPGVVW